MPAAHLPLPPQGVAFSFLLLHMSVYNERYKVIVCCWLFNLKKAGMIWCWGYIVMTGNNITCTYEPITYNFKNKSQPSGY